MKNIKFIALISPLILCGCASAKPNVAVVLESGEGTFPDGKTYLILSNVKDGTPLNEIEGYTIPTKDKNYDFNFWVDESGNTVKANVQITANAKFTASYIENIEYFREKYCTQINNEIQNVLDYALEDQIRGLDYTIEDAMNDIKPMTEVLNDSKITSIELLTQLYHTLHECIQTINQIPSSRNQQPGGASLSSYYQQLTQICNKEIKEIQKAQSISQIEALGSLAKNDLATYRTTNRELVDKACEKYHNDVMNASNDVDLAVAEHIGGGFIRSSYILETEQEYENILSFIENKLKEAKQNITDSRRLITFIEFLGDCTSNYCKIIKSDSAADITTYLEEMYAAALQSFTKSDAFSQQKYQRIASLIKGNAYNLYPRFIEIIQNESDLVNQIDSIIETKQLPIESVMSITNIVANGAKALDNCTEYSYEPVVFINNVMPESIDKYIETPDFLEFILYGMDVAQNIVPDDVYVKEGGTGFDGSFIDINKLKTSLDVAYNYYKQDHDPDMYEDAFKIIVKGIIKSCVYGNDIGITGLEPSIGIVDHLLSKIYKGNVPTKSVALGHACIIASVPTLYSYIGRIISSSTRDEIYSKIYDFFMYDKGQWEEYFGFIQNEQDEDRIIKVGSMVNTQLGLNFARLIQPHVTQGTPPGDAFNTALADLLKWTKQISKISPAAHTPECFDVLENAIYETINSSRIHHFAGVNDWAAYISKYQKIVECIESLTNTIYASTNPTQMTNRTNVYVDKFFTVLNKWCINDDEIVLETLTDETLEEMNKY